MKYFIILLLPIFVCSCEEQNESLSEKKPSTLFTQTTLGPLQQTIHDTLIHVVTREIESSRNTVNAIQIDGLEVLKISMKAYYTFEMEAQETNFKEYLQYSNKTAEPNNKLNTPLKLEESKARHAAVLAYLKQAVLHASEKPDVYKVVYYLKADANKLHYDQLKTTYLDSSFKKITADYSMLKVQY